MTNAKRSTDGRIGLRAGDWVTVRSRAEILRTLDANACLDGLPFQPEMLAFAGRRLRVSKVAHKTCDNIMKTGGRTMRDAVHLEGARCDGGGHGGCQADCVFFWKEAWLTREPERLPESQPLAALSDTAEDKVWRAARISRDADDPDPTWVCQTTQLYKATTPLNWWDVRQYVRDVTTRNHTASHMLRIIAFALFRKIVGLGYGYRYLVSGYNKLQGVRGRKPFPIGNGVIPDKTPTPDERIDLQPGEWVEVKSQEEILATITRNGFNRGMRYDMEMSKYCGEKFKVQMRVDRLINEVTGKMMIMKSPCIQLEDVYCRAECTAMRLGCPRASNTYWREIWLKRLTTDAPHECANGNSRRADH